MPAAAAWLGGAGALPFVAGALLVLVAQGPLDAGASLALRAYGACILSFMGGIHWGLAIQPAAHDPSWSRLGTSVLPALIAWAALLLPMNAGLLMLAAAFALLLSWDLRAVGAGHAPRWYPRLRWPLTITVVACLTLGALA